jgi:hypothetical protein
MAVAVIIFSEDSENAAIVHARLTQLAESSHEGGETCDH